MDLVEAPPDRAAARHPWETARFAFFHALLARDGLLAPGARVLDVGAGDGWFAARLAAAAPGVHVVGWDVEYAARGAPADAPGATFTAAPPAGRHDLLLLLDVLEHVEDDAGFLAGLVRDHLAPGGHVVLSVPAWPALFGAHDRRLRHRRRYAPSAARALLAGAGLEVVRAGGLFHALLPVRALQRLLEAAGGSPPAAAGDWSAGPARTGALARALAVDTGLSLLLSSRGLALPGLSFWATCRAR